jgi:hypothetical protein
MTKLKVGQRVSFVIAGIRYVGEIEEIGMLIPEVFIRTDDRFLHMVNRADVEQSLPDAP